MAYLNFVLNIVLVSIIINANCHSSDAAGYTAVILNKEGLNKSLTPIQNRKDVILEHYNYEYFFKDNETIELLCKVRRTEDWCRSQLCEEDGIWSEVPNPSGDFNYWNSAPKSVFKRKLQKEDHGTVLKCNSSTKGVKSSHVKLLFDPTHFLDPVFITMDDRLGTFLKEKWTFVNITRTLSEDKEKYHEIIFYNYEYKVYDGEDTQFYCTKYDGIDPVDVDIVVQTQRDRSNMMTYKTASHSLDDNIVSLICSAQVNDNMVHVVTKMVWDPTDKPISDTITMDGFSKDRWIFLNQKKEDCNKTYFFNYTFHDGETSDIVCSKENTGSPISCVTEINSNTLRPAIGKSENFFLHWNPSYHNATLTCKCYNSATSTIINTRTYWNYSHPEKLDSSYFQYEGFDFNRLESLPGLKNYAVYKFIEEEILNLTCTKEYKVYYKPYSIPGYTKWIYDNSLTPLNVGNAKESSSIRLQLKSNLNEKKLICAYYLDDTVVDSQVVILKKNVTQGNDRVVAYESDKNDTHQNYNDDTHANNEKEAVTSPDDSKDKVDYLPWVYGTIVLIVLLVAIGIIFIIKQKRKERFYENLPNNTSSNQFPPNLENIYAVPFGGPQQSEQPEYANAKIQEIETYSLPYLENNVENHQTSLQSSSPYTSSTQDTYASLDVKYPDGDETTTKPSVQLYSQVFKKSERKVEKRIYENAKDAENVEPAYCEIIKKQTLKKHDF